MPGPPGDVKPAHGFTPFRAGASFRALHRGVPRASRAPRTFRGPARQSSSLRPARYRKLSDTPPLNSQALQTFILSAPVLLFSVVAHEVAHGYAALKQGDDTALMLGRLTFNPIKHIDPFMTIILPLALAFFGGPILGGAKPVPVNPRKYRQFKRGDIIVSLAGIVTNIALAVVCTILMTIIGLIPVIPALAESQALLQAMMGWGVLINLWLAAFNLLPVPPLDGSHVLKYLLPPGWALGYQRVGFFGIIILLFLLQTPFLNYWLAPATHLSIWSWGLAGHAGHLFANPLAPWGGPG
jgi:Zn-dependent protease